jgi:hypothetical protein
MIQTLAFTITDKLPLVRAFLRGPNGKPADCSTGTTVKFRLVNKVTQAVAIDDVLATLVNAATAEVQYQWTGTQTDLEGEFWAWFIRVKGGLTEHHPTGRRFLIKLEPRT